MKLIKRAYITDYIVDLRVTSKSEDKIQSGVARETTLKA